MTMRIFIRIVTLTCLLSIIWVVGSCQMEDFPYTEVTISAPDSVVLGMKFDVIIYLRQTDRKNIELLPLDFPGINKIGETSVYSSRSLNTGKLEVTNRYKHPLEANQLGTFITKPPIIRIGTREIQIKPIKIKVVSPKFDNGYTDTGVILNTEVSSDTVFLGEAIKVDYVVYTNAAFDYYWEPSIKANKPAGFHLLEVRIPNTYEQKGWFNGKCYDRKVFKRTLFFPQLTGNWIFRRDSLHLAKPKKEFSYEVPDILSLNCTPYQFTILDFPEDAPPEFTGAVNCSYFKEKLKDSLQTKGFIDLEIKVISSGDINKVIPASPIEFGENVCEVVREIKDELGYFPYGFNRPFSKIIPTDSIVFTRTIKYRLIPTQPGLIRVAPRLTYFDTQQKKFDTYAPNRWDFLIKDTHLSLNNHLLDSLNQETSYTDKGSSVVVVDISKSMNRNDVKPSRLAFVESNLSQSTNIFENHNFGLVVFDERATVLSRFHENAMKNLAKSKSYKRKWDSAIGDGLACALDMLAKVDSNPKNIVLISDGYYRQEGYFSPLLSAYLARKQGVRIFSVAIGLEKKIKIPMYKDVEGKIHYGKRRGELNLGMLKEIAEISDGIFFHPKNKKEFQQALQKIDIAIANKTPIIERDTAFNWQNQPKKVIESLMKVAEMLPFNMSEKMRLLYDF